MAEIPKKLFGNTIFRIEDTIHAEFIGSPFDTFEDALLELRKMNDIPFGEGINRPPCTSWQNCYRDYHIVAFDDSEPYRKVISKTEVLFISADAVMWVYPK